MSYQAVARVMEYSKSKGTAKVILLKIAELDRNDGKPVYPAISTLSAGANCSERQVQRHLKTLQKNGELKVTYATGRNNTNEYILLVNGDIKDIKPVTQDTGDISVKVTSKVINGDTEVKNSDTQDLKGVADTTRTITKEPINTHKKKKSLSVDLEDYIFSDGSIPENLRTPEFIAAWKMWVEFRAVKKKKPITNFGARKELKRLAGHSDPVGVLEYSLEGGYQGIFPNAVENKKPQKTDGRIALSL